MLEINIKDYRFRNEKEDTMLAFNVITSEKTRLFYVIPSKKIKLFYGITSNVDIQSF